MADWTTPDVTYYIGLSFSVTSHENYDIFLPQLNNQTFQLPSRPFLLQNEETKLEVCNLENREKSGHENETEICGEGFCDCSHIVNVEFGKVVELIFVNEGRGACHPMHLHEFNYRVVLQQKVPEGETSSVQYVKKHEDQIQRKRVKEAIQKDTVVVPQNGYTVIQFRANNPGWWYLHCHFETHLALGMTMVVHVEDEEVGDDKNQLPAVPIEFPNCGNWPIDRETEAEAFRWSEEHLGPVDRSKNAFFDAIAEQLIKVQPVLQEKLQRKFKTYEVMVHRVRTDPVTGDSGYHYYLFKVDTGENRYIHLQFETPARSLPPEPVLIACNVDLHAQSPLVPMKVNSEENICFRQSKRLPFSSSASAVKHNSILCTFIVAMYTLANGEM